MEQLRTPHPGRARLAGRNGFSLLELLTVLFIMAFLSTASLMSVSAIFKSSRINMATTQITGLLEKARQYSVANNTYTWVAFCQSNGAPNDSGLYCALVASRDGTDPTEGFSIAGTVPADKVVMLEKSITLPQIAIKTAGSNAWSGLPAVEGPANLSGTVTFSLQVPMKAHLSFNHVVQFGPSGEARVASGLAGVIEMGLRSVQGGGVEDTHNMAVIRIAGMTGQTRLYRP